MLKRLFRRRSETKSVGETVGVTCAQPRSLLSVGDRALEDIHENLLGLETVFQCKDCLAKHKITQKQRAKMVDWMIEVTSQFGCATQTFYLSVSLMDAFFLRHSSPLPPAELHAIGVASMFIASKLEDVYPLRLKVVHSRIASGKLSESKIKSMESTILTALSFTSTLATPWDFLTLYFTLFQVPVSIEKTAECILRLSLLYYDTLAIPASRRALASFVIACTCSNKVGLVPLVMQAAGVRETDLNKVTDLMYAHVMDYPDQFPGYHNCSRFLGFQLTGKVPGPLFRFDDEVLERQQQRLFQDALANI